MSPSVLNDRLKELRATGIVALGDAGYALTESGAELVRRRPGWQSVPAVRAGQIHAISEEFLGRPGPRLVQGYHALRRLIEQHVQ